MASDRHALLVLGSAQQPGRLRLALADAVARSRAAGEEVEPTERAAAALDELLASTFVLAATAGAPPLGPPPLAARMIRG